MFVTSEQRFHRTRATTVYLISNSDDYEQIMTKMKSGNLPNTVITLKIFA